MHTLHPDPNLELLLKDKLICVVGPSPDLRGTKSGERINKFDLVVRTNGSIEIPEDYAEDYGARTDIVYMNNNYLRRRFKSKGGIQDTFKQLDRQKVKLVVVKGPKTQDSLTKIGLLFKSKTKFISTSYNFKQLCKYWVRNTDANNKMTLYEPTLAVYILSDLLIYKPKAIMLTGMNFYSSSKHWAGFYNKRLNQKKHAINRQRHHHVLGDKAYIKHMMTLHPDTVKVDPIIKDLLFPSG